MKKNLLSLLILKIYFSVILRVISPFGYITSKTYFKKETHTIYAQSRYRQIRLAGCALLKKTHMFITLSQFKKNELMSPS